LQILQGTGRGAEQFMEEGEINNLHVFCGEHALLVAELLLVVLMWLSAHRTAHHTLHTPAIDLISGAWHRNTWRIAYVSPHFEHEAPA
jgi:fumarate reductase subunit D